MAFADFIFYFFAFITVASGVGVIASRNPVHSVLFLILSFVTTAALFILIGAEYIAMTLIIVYVGAVAVLFLFVVMMLDVNVAELRQGFVRYLPVGLGIGVVMFAQLVLIIAGSLSGAFKPIAAASPTPDATKIENTRALGNVLYTDYALLFQVCGLILLTAMIGAIVLTLRQRPGVRRQSVARQMARKRSDSVEVISVKSGSGI